MNVKREITLDAPPEEVWEALTEPDRLEEWFANDVDFDLERGGTFRWGDGETRHAVVEEAVPERRLAIRWWDPDGPEESEVTFTLVAIPAGTRLIVTETASCDWAWGIQATALRGVNVGSWPAGTRRAAASSVAPIVMTIGAPCVLASLGAVDPGARQHHPKSHAYAGRRSLLSAV